MLQKTLSFWLRWNWGFRARSPVPAGPSAVESREDLVSEPATEDRRCAIRHACGLGISCQPIALVRSAPWPGVIQDVSATGLAVALDYPLPPGTFLALQLPLSDGMKAVRARIVSARPQLDGGWVLGCTLTHPLQPEELRSLV